jgi:hypothetical protein
MNLLVPPLAALAALFVVGVYVETHRVPDQS